MSPKPQRLFLVCLNDRGEDHPRGSCARAGGDALLDRLRAEIVEGGLKGAVRAIGTRCIGQCAHGPAVCVQPEDVYYGGVQAGDVDELIETHARGGRAVERLRLADEDVVGKSAAELPLPPFEAPPK